MQTREEKIPKSYVPYSKLILCGNVLNNVQIIIEENGLVPILIGEDKTKKTPLIWLKTRTKEGVISLVEKNIPFVNIIAVNNYKNDNQMDVILDDKGEKHILLQIENIDAVPEVTKLDLRTIGYNIYGDKNALHIGNTNMIGNTFEVNTLIQF